MKTIGTILFATFLLLPWCLSPTFGQQPAANADKKIVITKRTVDSDGTETTETIIKKGKAAENFDAEAYLRDNEGDGVDIQIREESADGNYTRITTSKDEPVHHRDHFVEVDWDMVNDAMNEVGTTLRGVGQDLRVWNVAPCADKDPHGFLGVEEDSDEDPDVEGLVVEVVKGSGAEKAGLKNNDVLLSINDNKINRWSDLTKFMAGTKPGDEVRIAYKRGDKTDNTTATLTERFAINVSGSETEKHGFLGVSPDGDDDEDAVGVAVDVIKESAAATAGLQDGDVITALNDTEVRDWEDIEDFMGDTKTGDVVRVSYQRGSSQNTASATLGESKNNWNSDSNQNWNYNFNQDWSNDFDVEVREKPACLGVYSGAWAEGKTEGSKVSGFTDESAARDASMQIGDVIIAVNGQAVHSHDELWNEIAKYQPGDKVAVEYLRDNGPKTIEATLKACKDQNKVTVTTTDEDGPNTKRQFYTWGWGNDEQQRMRTRRVITIRRASTEGDAAPTQTAPPPPPAQDRSLQLQAFRAYPNPTGGPVTIEFRGEAVPTIVTMLDLSGRQLFREELNAFNGEYNQQFDLNEYAKGTILIQVQQGGKIFTEQVIVN